MNIRKVLEENQELYNITFNDFVSFEFRLLKIREFNLFNKLIVGGNMPPFFIYEEIFELCYIGKASFINKNTPVGFIISTGNLIYNLSGGESGEQFLLNIAEERQKSPADSMFEHMKSIIFLAFQSLSLKDIDNMTEKEFKRNFVAAENLLVKTKENFKRLDLKAIYDELYNPEPKVKEKIDKVENVQQMEQELGYWNVKEAEEKFLKEELEKVRQYAKSQG